MSESSTRRLALLAGGAAPPGRDAAHAAVEQAGLADVVTLQSRAATMSDPGDERSFFHDTVAEYGWARDVAGLASTTQQTLIKSVLEVCDFYNCVPWHLTSRQIDYYFAGPGKRAHATIRKKLIQIDSFSPSLSSAMPARSPDALEQRSNHRSTRSTGRTTAAISVYGSRPHDGRHESSSPRGGSSYRRPASTR